MRPIPLLTKSALLALMFAAHVSAKAVGRDFGQAVSAEAGVTISPQNGYQRISAPGIEASVAPDGCFANLLLTLPGEHIVFIPDFFKLGFNGSGIGGSRGAFFYQDGFIPLPDVRQDGPSAVVAKSRKAAARYEIAPYEMRWTLTNKTDRPMQFLMVINSPINAVIGGNGKIFKTPVTGLWPVTTWFRDSKYKLRITGGDRVWSAGLIGGTGWRQGQFQIWEATLKPKENRLVVLTASIATKEEVAAVTAIAPIMLPRGNSPVPVFKTKPAVDGALRVYSPCDYQVFQRQTRTQGNLLFDGEVRPAFEKVQARITGTSIDGPLSGAWMDVPLNHIGGFHGTIPVPAGGWYQVDLRALDKRGKEVAAASLPHVGVGEVFVTCGQSNATNCAPERTRTQTGMVSSFGGDEWRLAEDPEAGAFEPYELGSPWPFFGDAMFAKYHVPIGVAVTGLGGAPVSTWRPDEPAFAWLMDRINQLGPGGFRALLWLQGESDVASTNEIYFKSLSATIAASYAEAGWKLPWFTGRNSYHTPKQPLFPVPRGAQQRFWTEGITLEGPDTDTLTDDYRAGGGAHFNAKGLKAHGELWVQKVSTYLDQILAE